ncbi:pentatricopeptide repeat-containing protein At3g09040, mitochondrial isoform X2 [Andrographis paniculata]|uniref:pentatricopeptide repeat-containing protein At3g09040, mitochondrial isoform X2 n=1 Tax=Andrographis paniculata TaxID=175694 RepID=UPI0021E74366|nr:pentatricopeptide repeat-containing protein At3g09040, mitochondrial isoform X2 [Andrographis paniculata]
MPEPMLSYCCIRLPKLKSNYYPNHRFRFLTAQVGEDSQTQRPLVHELVLRDHLSRICLQECRKIQARQLLDQMPQRLDISLKTAKTAHAKSLRVGVSSHPKLGNSILDLYSKCGHTDYAEKVFLHLERRDEMAWNSIMVMKSRKGLFKDVREGFGSMWRSGVKGNVFSFAIVSSACAKLMDLELGVSQAGMAKEAMELFNQMQKLSLVPDHVVFVTVLSACVRQGRLEDARHLFSQMPSANIVAWNVMISGHVKSGNEEQAIEFFRKMIESGIKPTRSTVGSVLSAVATLANHEYGLQVHCWAAKQGLDSNVYAGSGLVNMYAKCRKLDAARAVFDRLDEKNDVLWNALLGGYAQNGRAHEVLELFADMKRSGFQPDEFTYTSVLSSCACLGDIDMGRRLHSVIIKNEYGVNLYVQNALLDMYAKCGDLFDARKLFEGIGERDRVSWNAIIVGYVQEDQEQEALSLFLRMMSEGIVPDEVSLSSTLSATAKLRDLSTGIQLHCLLVKYGLEKGLYAAGSLIDMYCKCGEVEAADSVFSSMPKRNVVCVNALISGHTESSLQEAVNIFKRMLWDELQPSEVTFATLLEACSGDTHLHFGVQLHCFVVKLGFSFVDEYLSVSLLGMYVSSQRDTDAVNLFSELPDTKSTVIWTVLISGSAQNDHCPEALHWYRRMCSHGVKPDQATFVSVLRACSVLASLEDGRKIHAFVLHVGYDRDELTGSALVDMYAKCGDMNSSTQVFGEMISKKDVISWNSMIVGYAKNGYAKSALKIFNEMKRAGVRPDEVTFLGVLTACSHAGMIPEGRELYESMINDYRIQPRPDHCACMIDLFGRWGFLEEAEKFMENMAVKPDSMILAAYLNACRLHGDDVRGQSAAERLIELEPQSSSYYVLLSHMHAASGNWDGVDVVRKMMADKGVKKFSGSSKISMDAVG